MFLILVYFYVKTATPSWKKSSPLSQQHSCKNWDTLSSLPRFGKGGVHHGMANKYEQWNKAALDQKRFKYLSTQWLKFWRVGSSMAVGRLFTHSYVLVTSSSETGFVIQQPKGKSTFFIASYLEQVKKASQQVLMTGIIVNILALMKDHCISFNISLQRSTIKDQINVHFFEVQWNMYIMATFGTMKTWSL